MTEREDQAPVPPQPRDYSSWPEYVTAWDQYRRKHNAFYQYECVDVDIPGWDNYCIAWQQWWSIQGQAWRTQPEIDKARSEYLKRRCDLLPDAEHGKYPFSPSGPMPFGGKLTRADIEWLLAEHNEGNWLKEQLIGSNLRFRTGGLDLRGADLTKVNLSRLPLHELRGGLPSELWQNATKEQKEAAAIILRGANLWRVDLKRASMRSAHLEMANLESAHLEGASLRGAHLEGADLRGAHFDNTTALDDVKLGDKEHGFARTADVRWRDVNLTVIDWSQVAVLGDEQVACERCERTHEGKEGDNLKDNDTRLKEYAAGVRAYRQLATALRAQGLDGVAMRFAYRGQVLWRARLWLSLVSGSFRDRILTVPSLIFSLLLAGLAGYGYKLKRTLAWYFGILFTFAGIYYLLGQLTSLNLSFWSALVLSAIAFHGRGIFPGFANGVIPQLDSLLMTFIALEATFGLIIEVSFIAAFTQRIIGR